MIFYLISRRTFACCASRWGSAGKPRQLGFPVTPAFAATLEREQQRAKKHESTFTYSLEEFGLKRDEIYTALSDLFERYGWETRHAPLPRAEAASTPGANHGGMDR